MNDKVIKFDASRIESLTLSSPTWPSERNSFQILLSLSFTLTPTKTRHKKWNKKCILMTLTTMKVTFFCLHFIGCWELKREKKWKRTEQKVNWIKSVENVTNVENPLQNCVSPFLASLFFFFTFFWFLNERRERKRKEESWWERWTLHEFHSVELRFHVE